MHLGSPVSGDCPILGRTVSLNAKRGFGGMLPHYRVYMAPCAKRGFGGILPYSRDKIGLVGMIKFDPLKINPCSPWVCWVFLPLPCSPWVCWAFFPLPCSPWGMLGVFPHCLARLGYAGRFSHYLARLGVCWAFFPLPLSGSTHSMSIT